MDTLIGSAARGSQLLIGHSFTSSACACAWPCLIITPRLQWAGVIRCAAPGKSKSRQTAASGFGNKPAPKPSWDAGILLRRSEQLYGRLVAEHSKEGELREFVICVRQKNNRNSAVLDDWLPVAELALVSEDDASVVLPRALPVLCREVAECASKGAVSLRNIPRSCLEYAYEPAEAFYEYVLGGSQLPSLESSECPYQVLGLSKGASTAQQKLTRLEHVRGVIDVVGQVRTAYRSLAAKNHPDKHVGASSDIPELEFKRVTRAYDNIKRAGLATEGATYASLGGNARNGLSDPISINSTNFLVQLPQGVQAAVRQLDSEIVSRFLARSCARSGAATVV